MIAACVDTIVTNRAAKAITALCFGHQFTLFQSAFVPAAAPEGTFPRSSSTRCGGMVISSTYAYISRRRRRLQIACAALIGPSSSSAMLRLYDRKRCQSFNFMDDKFVTFTTIDGGVNKICDSPVIQIVMLGVRAQAAVFIMI